MHTQAKPFIKWVGGKTQLLKEIRESMPDDLPSRHDITYVEPFVGGGATLFWIMQEFPNITRAVINDINAELICTYRVINDAEQTRLRDFCRQVSERGALFVASNSDSTDDFFDSLYKGYAIKRVNAARMINSKGNVRGPIFEIMISNVTR